MIALQIGLLVSTPPDSSLNVFQSRESSFLRTAILLPILPITAISFPNPMTTTLSHDAQLAATLKELLKQSREEAGEGFVPYHPVFRRITRSTSAALLLSQILHYYSLKDCQPFYKFVRPCDHSLYKAGDSWTESLGWSYSEFTTALRKIGIKVTTGQSKNKARQTALVLYWTDSSRMTQFEVVLPNLIQAVKTHLPVDSSDKSGIATCLKRLDGLLTHQVENTNLPLPTESSIESTQINTQNAAQAVKEIEPKTASDSPAIQYPYINLKAYQSQHGFLGALDKHPLVTGLLFFFEKDRLEQWERTLLEKEIIDQKGQKAHAWPITKHYAYTPGYGNFVEDVLPNLARARDITIAKAIGFLQNFRDTGTSNPHWDPWREQNPTQLGLQKEFEFANLKEGESYQITPRRSIKRENGLLVPTIRPYERIE